MGFHSALRPACLTGAFLTLLSLSGCDWQEVNTALKNSWSVLTGADLSTPPNPSSSGAPGQETREGFEGQPENGLSTVAARNAQANSQILKELFQVVFAREPKDRAEFGNWADTLNQGASLEGVYNGLTRSPEYRKLESSPSSASAAALKVFGEELAGFESDLSPPTQFDASSALPPITLTSDTATTQSVENGQVSASHEHSYQSGETEVVVFERKPPASTPVSASASATHSAPIAPKSLTSEQIARSATGEVVQTPEAYSKLFVGASIFTLKRVLGEEALKVFLAKNAYREKMAAWYSKWVVKMASKNVNFGVALRNKADEAFHYKWAMDSTDDRIKWEILNRIHRLLNEVNGLKQ